MARKVWRIVRWGALLVALVLAYAGYRILWGKPFSINQLANRQAIELLMDNPELFTDVGIIEGSVLDHHSDKLEPRTLAKRDQDYAQLGQFLKEVQAFDRAALGPQDQVTYDILVDQWSTLLKFQRFPWLSSEGLYPISPMGGVEAQLPGFMETTHVIKNEKTARNYVKRLVAMEAALDGATSQMQWQARQGVLMPPGLIEHSLTVISDTTAGPPEKNELVTSLVARMDAVKELDTARKAQLQADAVAAVREHVYPAYERMSAALQAQKGPAAHRGAGVGELPDGAAFYAVTLRQMTTTDYTPAQVHDLGLKEVARISAEMDQLLRSQGITQGSVGERVAALGKDPRYLLPNTDAGRREMLERYQKILDEVNARMPEYFHTVPREHLVVQRAPAGQEKGSSGAYYEQRAMDGSRPGTFFVNLRDLSEDPTWSMKTLAYHEGIPGHHFQISTALGLKNLPFIRQQTLYSAYAEGWALYAEAFAAEIGMYKDDPLGDLGRLQLELMRAARLVVDTGLHAQGWTREQAIDYMVATTGMDRNDVTSEVERYMAMPGQACAYKIGQLKILELREKAKAALGPKFDIRDFHAVVLENGGVPLTLLEQLVDEWIAKVQATPTPAPAS
ncbi:MAG TPA: DUF885 domain-containing protein [Steroidobacteraceae bacterium]|nr:DUF885 domain-containing protein [Steroidobacteraceae bacterium]